MAPFGSLVWPPPVELDSVPTGVQQGLFVLLGLITSLSFGVAVAFLVFGWSAVKSVMAPQGGLAAPVFVSVVWVLGNWWLHDGLHMVVGFDPGGLLVLEYGFHVTLMAAGGTLAYSLVKMSRAKIGTPFPDRP
jgi:hypothetical protein